LRYSIRASCCAPTPATGRWDRRRPSAVAAQALRYASLAQFARPVLVNGAPGLLAAPNGRPVSLLSATVHNGKIVELDILADPERLGRLDLAAVLVD
jgi:RNA polymerase sigma-70 factor (ECF subfamily)